LNSTHTKPELHLKHKKRWKPDSQVVPKINMLPLNIAKNKSLHVPVPIPGSHGMLSVLQCRILLFRLFYHISKYWFCF